MSTADPLTQGREAFQSRAWEDAYTRLLAADEAGMLDAEDLERFAVAASLVGKDSQSLDLWTRAHHEFLRQHEVQRAVRCTFWLCFGMMLQGEPARSSGWQARGQRLLDDAGLDCVEQGYMLMTAGLHRYWSGDPAAALPIFEQAAAIGERHQDADLLAFTRLGMGETLAELGDVSRGVPLLDEVMAAVTANELTTLTAGIIYCAVVTCCQRIFDLRRAQEWTAAFTRWCEDQPQLGAYQAECMVYRAEIMQMRGTWPIALQEAQRACDLFSQQETKPWAGGAFYQKGEVHRLRGEFALAEEAYRAAAEAGQSPQPGHALLRLAQGRVEAASAAIARSLAEAGDVNSRLRILPAHVEIMLAAGDTEAARSSAEDLAGISASRNAPLLRAVSIHARGAVQLADGDLPGAITTLRTAWNAWNDLHVPYQTARVRVLLAQACSRLGDADGAAMELEAARRSFEQLGAAPDMERLVAGSAADAPERGRLTSREVEVLRLMAAGRTNRSIAAELVLSEKTVARHVSNIFAKLDLSSRSAATAYAYEHHLL